MKIAIRRDQNSRPEFGDHKIGDTLYWKKHSGQKKLIVLILDVQRQVRNEGDTYKVLTSEGQISFIYWWHYTSKLNLDFDGGPIS